MINQVIAFSQSGKRLILFLSSSVSVVWICCKINFFCLGKKAAEWILYTTNREKKGKFQNVYKI